MSGQRNAYLASAVRLEGHELRWGDPHCKPCKGRGWHFVGEGEESLDVASCPYCSETQDEEDEDRLNERLFIAAAIIELLRDYLYDTGEEVDEPLPEDLN